MRKKFVRYLRSNGVIFLTLGCAFLIGVALGALGQNYLNEETKAKLQMFAGSLLQEQPKTIDFAFSQYLIRENLIMMFFIWVLGLTVVGIPFVYLIILIRGVVLGFSVCFFIVTYAWKGLGFALLAMVLPSVFYIACLLMGSGLATRFSFHLMSSRTSAKPLRGHFSHYSLLFLLTTLGLVASSFLQEFCTVMCMMFITF
jgi:stage II sporulation protein M